MPKYRSNIFSCFSCRKSRGGFRKVTKFEETNRECTESLEDLRRVKALANSCDHTTKQNDREGSTKETLSLSTTSQVPVFGDGTSASLGGWSSAQHPDSMDVSKVNLIASEDSGSLIRPILGGLSRSSELSEECYERMESLVTRLEKLAGLRPSCQDDGLSAFQFVIQETLPHYMSLSAALSEATKRQSDFVKEAFELVAGLIKLSTTYSKPSQSVLEDYMKPLSYKLLQIADFNLDVEPVRRYELVTVAESAIALCWCSCPTASQFVKEVRETANMNVNKVFQFCYSSHSTHVDWIRSWMDCLRGVQDVVNRYFPHGLCWVPNGPKAPAPPKPVRPVLRYDPSKSTAEQRAKCSKRSAPTLFAKSDGTKNAGSGDGSLASLLSEIPNRRNQLRHVSKPELF
ncbi:unnamed protein product [Calicophoron daubneyi]|uniref:CAP N-terminal domain-containing protein n=1 Tax=Calicophoron daubneyi TaxID=300641 RepID=A0AAV2T3I3_CALDB